MSSLKRFSGGGTIVVTISLRSEVNKLLLPVRTSLNHSFLTGSIRSNHAVAFHFRLGSHYPGIFIVELKAFIA